MATGQAVATKNHNREPVVVQAASLKQYLPGPTQKQATIKPQLQGQTPQGYGRGGFALRNADLSASVGHYSKPRSPPRVQGKRAGRK